MNEGARGMKPVVTWGFVGAGRKLPQWVWASVPATKEFKSICHHLELFAVYCKGVARVFGARGADFNIGANQPPKKFEIPKNLRNCLNCSAKCWLSLKTIQNVIIGRFLVLVGEHLGPYISIFLEDLICFLLGCGGPKTSINNDFF